MMILAMFVGFFQMRELKFEEGNKSKDKIIIVTAFGMFAYSTFTIIAGKKSKKLKFFCYFYPTMHMRWVTIKTFIQILTNKISIYFQIIGLLNEKNIEPGALVVTNGIVELLQVSSILAFFFYFTSFLQFSEIFATWKYNANFFLLMVRIKFCGNCELWHEWFNSKRYRDNMTSKGKKKNSSLLLLLLIKNRWDDHHHTKG